MTITQIDLDEDVLRDVAAILGTTTTAATVDAVLRAIVIRHRQQDVLARAHTHGTFANSPIHDEAWR